MATGLPTTVKGILCSEGSLGLVPLKAGRKGDSGSKSMSGSREKGETMLECPTHVCPWGGGGLGKWEGYLQADFHDGEH